MTLLLRCVSAGIELRCHLGHAYIISNTLYTGCTPGGGEGGGGYSLCEGDG